MTGGDDDNAGGDNGGNMLGPASDLAHKLEGCAIIDDDPQPSQTIPRRKASWRRKGLEIFETLCGSSSSSRANNHSRRNDEQTQAELCEKFGRESGSTRRKSGSGWLRRTASMRFHHHRRSSTFTRPPTSYTAFVPSFNMPPLEFGPEHKSTPRRLTGGAAARAAAAAQNESTRSSTIHDGPMTFRDTSSRSLTLIDRLVLMEPKVNNDAESGIGIDIRDRSDETDLTIPITRNDPSGVLPEEIFAHVISYLDAASLMKAELVSRRWYGTAHSYHSWRHVFWREHSTTYLSHLQDVPASQVGGLGLGKRRPDQNWKQMWKVRKLLNARWQYGQAAAVYLEGHKDSVYCVQFDEQKIITGSRDRTIRIWDAHTYECIKIIGVLKANGQARVYEDDRLIIANRGGSRPTVSIVPARPLAEPKSTEKPAFYHTGSILCLQFDEEIMVSGSSDHSIIVWDVANDYAPIRRLQHHSAGVLDVRFDDKHIVSCSKDTSICLWDRHTGELLRTLTGHRGPVNAVQLRGNLIVSASGDGIAKLWNLASGLCIKEFPSRDRGLACVEFSPDSRTILAGGNDQVIYHFDANSGELLRELKGHKGLVRSLHLDSANGRIISGSYDYSVKAYDLNSGDMICDFEGWTTSWMLSAKADYRRIVATSQDSRAVVMDFGHLLPGIELLEG
ncbi:hypothetical protein MMC30_001283 [Trapelia coarctata]|nr:hypothetical protein [Trapelia coarctata]